MLGVAAALSVLASSMRSCSALRLRVRAARGGACAARCRRSVGSRRACSRSGWGARLGAEAVLGDGHDTLSAALVGSLPLHVMAALVAAELLATVGVLLDRRRRRHLRAGAVHRRHARRRASATSIECCWATEQRRARRVRARRHGRVLRGGDPRADHVGADHLRDDAQLRPDPAADDRQHRRPTSWRGMATGADLRGAAAAGRLTAAAHQRARPRSPRFGCTTP